MKTLFVILLVLLQVHSKAQEVFVLQPTIIDPKDTKLFEANEIKYARELAQDAKNNGKISQWHLLKRVEGFGRAGGELNRDEKVNYMWVHIYKNPSQLANVEPWWQTEKKFGVPTSTAYGNVNRVDIGNFIYKMEKKFDTDRTGKYFIFNWAYPSSMTDALGLADKISDSFKGDMKKVEMSGWGMASRVYPQGKEYAPLFFWDNYEKLDQTLSHLMNGAVIKSIDPALLKQIPNVLPNGWHNRVVFEYVTGTK